MWPPNAGAGSASELLIVHSHCLRALNDKMTNFGASFSINICSIIDSDAQFLCDELLVLPWTEVYSFIINLLYYDQISVILFVTSYLVLSVRRLFVD